VSSLIKEFGFIFDMIKEYDMSIDNCFLVYIGDQIKDIQKISMLKLKSPLFVYSNDKAFLKNAKLYYSVTAEFLYENTSKELQ
jgi:hypothetical protein